MLPVCPLMSPHAGPSGGRPWTAVVLIPKAMVQPGGRGITPFWSSDNSCLSQLMQEPLLCGNTLTCCIALPHPCRCQHPAVDKAAGSYAPSLYLQSAQQVRRRLRITCILQPPFPNCPSFPLKHQSPLRHSFADNLL